MKTAIYIEDGIVQLVVTPESDFEKNALKSFKDKETVAQIYNGTFYDCRGGWTRQKPVYDHNRFTYDNDRDDCSLILRVNSKATQE